MTQIAQTSRDSVVMCVDIQPCFVDPKGCSFQPRPSVDFMTRVLVPMLRANSIKLAEIVSDYRSPRLADEWRCRCPRSLGKESLIPNDVKHLPAWVKAHNAPSWVRTSDAAPPRPDPERFGRWIRTVAGPPEANRPVILCGLTLDCCILCSAQELAFRGYRVHILEEGVDVYSGSPEEKRALLHGPLIGNWARPLSWASFVSGALT